MVFHSKCMNSIFWKKLGGAGANVFAPDLTSGYEVPEMAITLGRSSGEDLENFE